VDGRIRNMGFEGAQHGATAVRLGSKLVDAACNDEHGVVLAGGTGYRLPNGNVRAPDLGFVRMEHLANVELSDDFVPFAPDLAVEILSPNDRCRELLDKVGEYLQAGTRLVWVVDPDGRTVTVYRSPTDVERIGFDDTLDGEDVLPGFSCRLADFL
jgi:Uma2 family endonuclease